MGLLLVISRIVKLGSHGTLCLEISSEPFLLFHLWAINNMVTANSYFFNIYHISDMHISISGVTCIKLNVCSSYIIEYFVPDLQ